MVFRKNSRKGEDGQSMVEFAIVFPVLFMFFLAIIQTALLMTARQVVHYAAFCGARAAMVGYGEPKIARAAQIACIPISPKGSAGIMREFGEYASSLVTEMPWNVWEVSEQYWEFLPEMMAIADKLPGVDVAEKIMDIDISSLISVDTLQSGVGLAAGLLAIDDLCRSDQDLQDPEEIYSYYVIKDKRELDPNYDPNRNIWSFEVPARFALSYLLTDVNVTYATGVKPEVQDVTVEVTHNYVLRVPLINKVFYYMYVYLLLESDLKDRLSSLPDILADALVDRAFDAVKELSRISGSLPLYIIPIRESSSLTVETEFHSDKDDCDYCKRP